MTKNLENLSIITIHAPAKINIGLNIVAKRNDGYHNLETIFYQIHDLFDILIFEKADKLELILEDKNLELVNNNIIIKAIKLLELKTKQSLNVKIKLNKNIPIGAGLGGGSSDGASTLMAMNKLFNLNLSFEELKDIALELGSDVPLFLHNFPTIGESRGEHLVELNLKINNPILLINPGIHISTKEVFSNIIPKPNNFNYSNISNLKVSEWGDVLINDFEKNVFKLYHEIKEVKRTLLENGALFSLMSGTGSTVYGIFETLEKAKSVANLFPKSYFTFVGNL